MDMMQQLPDLSRYTKYKEKDEVFADDGSRLPNMRGEFFELIDEEGKKRSVGIFSNQDKPVYCAWGYMDEEHCSMFSVMGDDGRWITPQMGCPIKLTKKENDQVVALILPTTIGEFTFNLS